jgi:Transglycosylase
MLTFRTRGRLWWLGAIAAALFASLAALLLRSMLEHEVHARIESAAARHGVVARIGLVHVGVWPLLRLEEIDLEFGHGVPLHADMISATWFGRMRLAVRAAALTGPAGVRASSPATAGRCRAAGTRTPDVSPESPDFIALRDVPPLFARTLLLAEDAGFYGHRDIDLRELPTALLTNWSRGGAARGASTITQQLAKNLFLSRDKQLGRKLQELAITFMLSRRSARIASSRFT